VIKTITRSPTIDLTTAWHKFTGFLILFLLTITDTWACVTPASGADLRLVPGTQDTLTLVYGPFTTLGSLEEEYCASAFRLPVEFIESVDRVQMVSSNSVNPIAGLFWAQNLTTSAAVHSVFNAETGSQWFGFLSPVQREILPDREVDFQVRVTLKPGLVNFEPLLEPLSEQGSNRVYVGQANDNGSLIEANEDKLSGYGNAFLDTDSDGVSDSEDNCIKRANANQQDNDNDGVGNVCDRCPNDEADQCDASIPTVSEWGVILFTLLLVTVSVGFIRHYAGLFSAPGGEALSTQPLWVRATFFKALTITTLLVLGGIMLALGLALPLTGVDIIGLLVATPIVAYLLHLLVLPQ